MNTYDRPEIVNIGVGEDITIAALAGLVKQVVGFEGTLSFDTTKPDGTPRKLLDVSRLENLGWRASISLEEGVASTYRWFLENVESARLVSA
jgi:GDP-L-fucose synthase